MRDGHIHTPYCPHGSDDTFEKYIEQAIKSGLKEITFTEHLPLPINFEDPCPTKDSNIEESKLLDYFNDIIQLKNKYKDIIKINVGVEVDYIEGYEAEIKDMLNIYGEYIEDAILSVHVIKGKNKYYCIDYSPEEFKKIIDDLGSVDEVYNKYYSTLLLAVNSDLGKYKPKRIGHINLVRKFNKVYPYNYDSNPILREVIKLISNKNYELDYNVSGLRKGYCNEIYVNGVVLDLANEYNITMVLGSDSHSAKEISSIYSHKNKIKTKVESR